MMEICWHQNVPNMQTSSALALLRDYLGAVYENLWWYAAFVLPFFAFFWWWFSKGLQKHRIQKVPSASKKHLLHDLGYSVVSFFVFAIFDLLLLYAAEKGYTALYFDAQALGWWWLPLSLFIALFLDDAFFYWSHRAMHHPRWYPIFHRVHHQSTDPSPFTSFAFHPTEAVVEKVVHFVLPFVLPMHFGVLLLWQVLSMLNNVVGHLGYELYPQGFTRSPWTSWLSTSTHHNQHHARFNGNFGLYFTWWDRWMGTQFDDYESTHDAVAPTLARKKAAAAFAAVAQQPVEGQWQRAQVQLQLPAGDFQFGVNNQETLLEAALRQGVALPHACKMGRCGTCALRCAEGKVEHKANHILNEAALAEGMILACQALPLSAQLKLSKA